MADKQDSKDMPYRGERSTEPPKQTGDINFRNNNVEATTPGTTEPNVEKASDSGIGDQAMNDQKMTHYTSNHSADA